MPQALLKITGHVQGVFFRASAKEVADKLDLTGYAKNMADGSVEILASGEKSAIESLIAWCHEGPERGSPENVEVQWKQESSLKSGKKQTGFQIL